MSKPAKKSSTALVPPVTAGTPVRPATVAGSQKVDPGSKPAAADTAKKKAGRGSKRFTEDSQRKKPTEGSKPRGNHLGSNKAEAISKQSRVVAMLQSPSGATIAAMMKATGWQQHSVRGFLAGVVRKRLKLKLGSEKLDGTRVYRIASVDDRKSRSGQTKRKAS
jgi:hypothetical protein